MQVRPFILCVLSAINVLKTIADHTEDFPKPLPGPRLFRTAKQLWVAFALSPLQVQVGETFDEFLQKKDKEEGRQTVVGENYQSHHDASTTDLEYSNLAQLNPQHFRPAQEPDVSDNNFESYRPEMVVFLMKELVGANKIPMAKTAHMGVVEKLRTQILSDILKRGLTKDIIPVMDLYESAKKGRKVSEKQLRNYMYYMSHHANKQHQHVYLNNHISQHPAGLSKGPIDQVPEGDRVEEPEEEAEVIGKARLAKGRSGTGRQVEWEDVLKLVDSWVGFLHAAGAGRTKQVYEEDEAEQTDWERVVKHLQEIRKHEENIEEKQNVLNEAIGEIPDKPHSRDTDWYKLLKHLKNKKFSWGSRKEHPGPISRLLRRKKINGRRSMAESAETEAEPEAEPSRRMMAPSHRRKAKKPSTAVSMKIKPATVPIDRPKGKPHQGKTPGGKSRAVTNASPKT